MAMVTEEKKNVAARIGDGVGAAMGAVDMTQKWKNQRDQLALQRDQLGQQREAMAAQQAQHQEKLQFDSNLKQSELLGSFLKTKDKDKWMQVNASTLQKINGYTGGAPIDETRLMQISAIEQEELGTFLTDMSSMTKQIQALPASSDSLGKLENILSRREELMQYATSAPEAMEPFVMETIKQLDNAAGSLQKQISDQEKAKISANTKVTNVIEDPYTPMALEPIAKETGKTLAPNPVNQKKSNESLGNYRIVQDLAIKNPTSFKKVLGTVQGKENMQELMSILGAVTKDTIGFNEEERAMARQIQQVLGTERTTAIMQFANEAGARAIDSERELELFMASLVRANSDPQAFMNLVLMKKSQALYNLKVEDWKREQTQALASNQQGVFEVPGLPAYQAVTNGQEVEIIFADRNGKIDESQIPEGFKKLSDHITENTDTAAFDEITDELRAAAKQGLGGGSPENKKTVEDEFNLFGD